MVVWSTTWNAARRIGMTSDLSAIYVVGGLNATMYMQDSVWQIDSTTKLKTSLNQRMHEQDVNTHKRPKSRTWQWRLESERLDTPICNAGVVGPVTILHSRGLPRGDGSTVHSAQRVLLVFGGTMQNGTVSNQVQVVPVDATHGTQGVGLKFSVPEPMPTRRCCVAVVLAPGSWKLPRVFVAGGFDGSNKLGIVEALDLSTGKWTQLPSLNTPRSGFSLVATSWALFAIEGSDRNETALSSIETFDVAEMSGSTREWKFLGTHLTHARMYACSVTMPAAREDGSIAAANASIVTVGGTDCKVHVNGRCTSFTSVETITVTPPTPTRTARAMPLRTGSAVGGGRGLVTSGTAHISGDKRVPHPVLPPLRIGVHAMGCALTADGRLFVVGGEVTSNDFTNVTQYIALAQH